MGKFILEVETDETATLQVSRLDSAIPHPALQKLTSFLVGVSGGAYNAAINVKLGAVQASTTGTFTDDPAANGTITINGVVFTGRASGASGNEWNITSGGTAGADAAANAASLAAAINASATAGIVDVIYASSALGVVTFTSKQAGKVGNAVILSESLTNFTLAATALASGTQSTNRTFQFSKAPTTTY